MLQLIPWAQDHHLVLHMHLLIHCVELRHLLVLTGLCAIALVFRILTSRLCLLQEQIGGVCVTSVLVNLGEVLAHEGQRGFFVFWLALAINRLVV